MGDGCLAKWCVAQDRGERKIGCREWGCGTVRRPPQPRQAFSFSPFNLEQLTTKLSAGLPVHGHNFQPLMMRV